VKAFLEDLRSRLKEKSFSPSPVREKMIPKANGKLRRLGIPTEPANCALAQAV